MKYSINNVLNICVILFIMTFLSASTIYAEELTLSWNAPTADANGDPLTDLKGYTVYHRTEPGNYSQSIDVGNVTTYTVTGLTAGLTYYFAVTASDVSGNESEYSNEVSKTIQSIDSIPPVISGVYAGNITISSATINWTTNESADTQVEYGTAPSYGNITIRSSSLVTSHAQSISNLSPSTLYHYRVLSRDSSGNLTVSVDNTFMTAEDPQDSTPPTVPQNIQATAVSSSQVNLSWYASTDNVGVGGYKIFRNGTQITSINTTSYPDTGLSASTTFRYTVTAYDKAGNESNPSVSTTVTTKEAGSHDTTSVKVDKILMNEDFSGGIPSSWSSQGSWREDNQCGKIIDYPFVEPYAIVDSSCTQTGSDELITSPLDTSSCSTVGLLFSNQYYSYSGNVEIDVTTDGGTTWDNIIYLANDDGYPNPNWKAADISTTAGFADARIKFKYTNAYGDGFWALDNVWITCQASQVEFSSQIGVQSAPQIILLTNTGIANLSLGTITIDGSDASAFSITDNDTCSNQTLPPGGTCTVDVVFLSETEGSKNANLSIPSNASGTSVINIALAGTEASAPPVPQSALPVPQIRINGSTGTVNVTSHENLNITIGLASKDYKGDYADWWLLMKSPKRWYSFNASRGKWIGKWRRRISYYQQGPLFDMGEVQVLNSTLPSGQYIFQFGVDLNMNGTLDHQEYYYDEVTVNIQ